MIEYQDCPNCGTQKIRTTVRVCGECEVHERYEARVTRLESALDAIRRLAIELDYEGVAEMAASALRGLDSVCGACAGLGRIKSFDPHAPESDTVACPDCPKGEGIAREEQRTSDASVIAACNDEQCPSWEQPHAHRPNEAVQNDYRVVAWWDGARVSIAVDDRDPIVGDNEVGISLPRPRSETALVEAARQERDDTREAAASCCDYIAGLVAKGAGGTVKERLRQVARMIRAGDDKRASVTGGED